MKTASATHFNFRTSADVGAVCVLMSKKISRNRMKLTIKGRRRRQQPRKYRDKFVALLLIDKHSQSQTTSSSTPTMTTNWCDFSDKRRKNKHQNRILWNCWNVKSQREYRAKGANGIHSWLPFIFNHSHFFFVSFIRWNSTILILLPQHKQRNSSVLFEWFFAFMKSSSSIFTRRRKNVVVKKEMQAKRENACSIRMREKTLPIERTREL